jgi:hypothetical protein
LGFEPRLLSFPSSDRQVRVLHPIVLPQPSGSMQMTQIQLVECRTVRRQVVGRNRLWLDWLVVQEASEQLQGRLCVPPALDNEVEDLVLSG